MNHRIKLITIPFRFKSSLNNLTLSKKDATKIILDAKKQKGYSFENLAKNLNVNKVNCNLIRILENLFLFLGMADIGHSWPTSYQQRIIRKINRNIRYWRMGC